VGVHFNDYYFFWEGMNEMLDSMTNWGVHLNDYYFFREGIKEMLDSMTNWGGTLLAQ
jgi:hypothetical protein